MAIAFTVLIAAVLVTVAISTTGTGDSIAETQSWNCGADGSDVTATLDDSGKLTISGTGAMKDYTIDTSGGNLPYQYKNNTPWKDATVKSVEFGSGITHVGDYAFYHLASIEEVSLGAGIESIGAGSFYLTSISQLTIPGSLKSIGNGAFTATKITELTIPGTVTSIGSSAFSSCKLVTVDLSAYDGSLLYYTFGSNSTLQEITFSDGITSIATGAFSYQTVFIGTDGQISGVMEHQSQAFFDENGKELSFSDINEFRGRTFKHPADDSSDYEKIPMVRQPVGSSSHTVTFDLDGGTWDPEGIDADDDGKYRIDAKEGTYTVPTERPTKEDSEFVRWDYEGGSVLPGGTIDVKSNVSLKAIWSGSTGTHTIEFDVNGGDLDLDSVTVSGTEYVVPGYAGTKNDCRFIGWEYGGKTYASGAVLTLPSDIPKITLTAVWKSGSSVIPIIPPGDDTVVDGDDPVVIIVPDDEKVSWIEKDGKNLLILGIIAAIIAELAVLAISRKR